MSYRQLARRRREQGGAVDHTRVFRWGQRYGPERAKRCRAFLKPTHRSSRTEETESKGKGKDRSLYRAVDSTGPTMDCLLTAQRDKAAAQRFLQRALRDSAQVRPRVIHVDQKAASPAAVQERKAEGVLSRRCRLRPCQFLNNIVEQDHRNVKRRTRLAMGYGSFRTAWRTLPGIETMHLIGKGRVRRVSKGEVGAPVRFIHKLFGLAT